MTNSELAQHILTDVIIQLEYKRTPQREARAEEIVEFYKSYGYVDETWKHTSVPGTTDYLYETARVVVIDGRRVFGSARIPAYDSPSSFTVTYDVWANFVNKHSDKFKYHRFGL